MRARNGGGRPRPPAGTHHRFGGRTAFALGTLGANRRSVTARGAGGPAFGPPGAVATPARNGAFPPGPLALRPCLPHLIASAEDEGDQVSEQIIGTTARPPGAASGGASPAPRKRVGEVVACLDGLSDRERVSLRDVVRAFGRASFLPMLIVPALAVVSPLSGIPLLPSLCGMVIALIAGQMAVGRPQLWLPGILMRRTLSGAALHRCAGWLARLADWLDVHARDRLTALVHPPGMIAALALCVLAGLAMPFLEIVPFSSSVLGLGVALIAVGLLAQDGLYVLAGMLALPAALSIPFWIVGAILN